ncbi:uncharacterized protein NECHADRAFT_86840 [Fusarium vanettenii 77-13-4]|uniref:Uncharacterized protein n=1 Tax=Fusarium vanettenii (strain ATCC MYA-4622 / CBS 123669 / FGSC 9596 / NRRL 45880 / 77-13-4) TaxID=660122 RepID=C7ZK80_FUSV7|nr:uncharacterized protein NECHADRAFT_86840 [Fusarium vanettenii 77-13-4]EEU35631.1 hypothetical protein NECHADRAFT_86840 [Fusarium vanettenii 77-13-4]
MYLQRIGAIVAFLCFFLEAVWAAGCANVTIKSQDHADEVRKSCKTIEGYLKFDDYLDESINLDGIEFINGDITYSGDPEWGNATEIGGPYPTTLKPITIECSTLKTVNGSIYFWAFEGLSEFLLPKLTRVEEAFTLQRMHYLRKLDITKLTHLGSFNIEANHLTELKHEELKGFTGGAWTPGVQFWGVRVSSLDSWFKYPLTAIARESGYDDLTTWAPVQLSANRIPNLRSVTVGYANTSKISIATNKTELTLGGPETETMDIGLLQLEGDLTKLTRAPNVKELNVGRLYFRGSSLKEIDLTIFDKITNLTIYDHGNLQRIRMPPKALDWEDMTIDIEINQNLTLISEYRDPENKKDQFWYWPKGNISRINIIGTPLSTGFFDSFLAARNGSNPPKVLDYFHLAQAPAQYSEPMGFNCTPFEELYNKSVLPENYECLNYNSLSSASHVWMSWGFVGVALLSSVFYLSW